MSAVILPSDSPSNPLPPNRLTPWALPIVVLIIVYSLLGLTLTEPLTHQEIMGRCVLVDPQRARIWSVGNVEIGLAYAGVFAGMLFYFLKIYSRSREHMIDFGLAMSYLLCSFALDYYCVKTFHPFFAMLIGDAIVMTFTVLVSRKLWFQRLLGVFVPMIFFSCGVGHFLEGLSYWQLTYTFNTPWTMVTADVGFAILVNASRFPAFIRGEDVVAELAVAKDRAENLLTEIAARRKAEREKDDMQIRVRTFLRDVLASVTEGKLNLCDTPRDLPQALTSDCSTIPLSSADALHDLRMHSQAAALTLNFQPERWQDLITAVSEAGMNAIVHGGGGSGRVCAEGDTIQIWIEDHGEGITVEHLPRATLEKGFTTAGTLGYGMKMMLQTADRIWLLTGTTGTTVVLEQDRIPFRPDWAAV